MKQVRFEFKYILHPAQVVEARDIIHRCMNPDPFAPSGSYTVTSLYFDTPTLSDYYEKSSGFLDRKKVRARIYAQNLARSDGMIWLEIKRKHNAIFRKIHTAITKASWDLMIEHRYSELLKLNTSDEIRTFLWDLIREKRTPTSFIRYQRTPYVGTHDPSFRITLDSDIETARHDDLTEPLYTYPVKNVGAILEVKFSETLPPWFGHVVRNLDLTRTSFSKYAKSIETASLWNPLPR
ncbi:MAG: polyphosphate polymerase domain-containing protein [Patescibacteria group bacterium]